MFSDVFRGDAILWETLGLHHWLPGNCLDGQNAICFRSINRYEPAILCSSLTSQSVCMFIVRHSAILPNKFVTEAVLKFFSSKFAQTVWDDIYIVVQKFGEHKFLVGLGPEGGLRVRGLWPSNLCLGSWSCSPTKSQTVSPSLCLVNLFYWEACFFYFSQEIALLKWSSGEDCECCRWNGVSAHC